GQGDLVRELRGRQRASLPAVNCVELFGSGDDYCRFFPGAPVLAGTISELSRCKWNVVGTGGKSGKWHSIGCPRAHKLAGDCNEPALYIGLQLGPKQRGVTTSI